MTVRNLAVISLLVLSGCQETGGFVQSLPRQRSFDNGDFFAAIAARYARCETYEDSGIVFERKSRDQRNYFTTVTSFHTAFDRRRNGYRYEFSQNYTEFFGAKIGVIVQNSRDGAQVWWSVTGRSQPSTVYDATMSFKGVADWSAYRIPALLFGWQNAFRGASLLKVRDEILDGQSFVRMEGSIPDYRVTVWVDPATSLIRRVHEIEVFGKDEVEHEKGETDSLPALRNVPKHTEPFETDTITDYAATIDRPVNEMRFFFTPPDQVRLTAP